MSKVLWEVVPVKDLLHGSAQSAERWLPVLIGSAFMNTRVSGQREDLPNRHELPQAVAQ